MSYLLYAFSQKNELLLITLIIFSGCSRILFDKAYPIKANVPNAFEERLVGRYICDRDSSSLFLDVSLNEDNTVLDIETNYGAKKQIVKKLHNLPDNYAFTPDQFGKIKLLNPSTQKIEIYFEYDSNYLRKEKMLPDYRFELKSQNAFYKYNSPKGDSVARYNLKVRKIDSTYFFNSLFPNNKGWNNFFLQVQSNEDILIKEFENKYTREEKEKLVL